MENASIELTPGDFLKTSRPIKAPENMINL